MFEWDYCHSHRGLEAHETVEQHECDERQREPIRQRLYCWVVRLVEALALQHTQDLQQGETEGGGSKRRGDTQRQSGGVRTSSALSLVRVVAYLAAEDRHDACHVGVKREHVGGVATPLHHGLRRLVRRFILRSRPRLAALAFSFFTPLPHLRLLSILLIFVRFIALLVVLLVPVLSLFLLDRILSICTCERI